MMSFGSGKCNGAQSARKAMKELKQISGILVIMSG